MSVYHITQDFSSNPALGAENVSDLGSQFDVFLNPSIHIPKLAKNIYCVIDSATVWFNTPNVIEVQNNNFRITYQATTYDIELATGLYSVDALSNKIRLLTTII